MKRDPKKIKCSKCGEMPSVLDERWNHHSIQFQLSRSGIIDEEGELNPGDPSEVYAICDCGHEWKLKGVRQIDDLR